MTDIAISVKSISKCYQVYDNPRDRLRQFVLPRLSRFFGRAPQQYFDEFWSLRDVSFEIKKGETVGIIGQNGSGKSTLLQIICGTLFPTIGHVETKGRIAALLELGSGFNPEFTGRENVYMNAAVLGLTKREVDERFDDIAAFADIGDFIEQPVKTYSSGMYVRLAFAVNILSKPDIMIVDEALAVGDMAFQAKCMTALTRIQDSGATVLFVSHDISALKSLCSKGIFLEHGAVKAIGRAPDVAEMYIKSMREKINAEQLRVSKASLESATLSADVGTAAEDFFAEKIEKSNLQLKFSEEFDRRVSEFRYGSGGVKVTYVEVVNMDDQPLQSVEFNQEVKIQIHVESSLEQMITVNFNIRDDKKVNIVGCDFTLVDQPLLKTEIGGQYLIQYTVRLPLQEGSYSLRTQITTPAGGDESSVFLDVVEDAVVFQVARWSVARVWSKVHLFPSFQLQKLGVHG